MRDTVVRTRMLGNRRILVIDGHFGDVEVHMIHRYLSDLPYWRMDYDTIETKEHLNLRHNWPLEDLGGHPMLKLMHRAMTQYVNDNYEDYQPDLLQAYANEMPYGGFTNPHFDAETGVTALYFGNSAWKQSWQGEIIFYDEGEPSLAIAPRPGRILLFPADAVHRAGVPSRMCNVSRISVAFKYHTEIPVA